jgi:hypothetical protein
MGRTVPGAEPKTFEVLLGSYARDANSVFFGSSRSQKIDRATFRVLSVHFGVDAQNAYFSTTPIADADPKSFRVLDSARTPYGSPGPFHFLTAAYVADATRVWFCSNRISKVKDADPLSFVSLGNRFGRDKERVYFEHTAIVGADLVTWRAWRDKLSADRDNMFFCERKVPGVDRPSIALLTAENCFMDRNRVYSNGQAVSVEEYLERLKHCEEHCAWEREWLANGKMFERLLDEWPQYE